MASFSMTERGQNNSFQNGNKVTGIKQPSAKRNGKSTNEIIKLQGMIGNRAVSQMMRGNTNNSVTASEKRLPQDVTTKMEQSFSTSFSDVKVHEDPKALSMGARAYAQGNNIVFAPGQFSPNTQKGQSLIGHELSHIVQQREGRVKRPAGGSALALDTHLEKSADMEGERASAGRQARESSISSRSAASSGPAVQMKPIDNNNAPIQASFFSAIGNFGKKALSGIKKFGSKAINVGMKAGKSFVANGGLQMMAGMYANRQAGGGLMNGFVNNGGLSVASGMLGGGQQGEQQGGQGMGGQQAGGGDALSTIMGLVGNLFGGGKGQQEESGEQAGSDAHQLTKKRAVEE